ncbi:MAG: hypothetical protein JXQ71_11440 [Verrucomicrobia bacterium]|nr:hypothetical protein [Verrucomicrobiota bacterium]
MTPFGAMLFTAARASHERLSESFGPDAAPGAATARETERDGMEHHATHRNTTQTEHIDNL